MRIVFILMGNAFKYETAQFFYEVLPDRDNKLCIATSKQSPVSKCIQ